MYETVLYALLGLLGFATAFSAFGLLHYDPLLLVASSATLVGVSVVVNWLVGYCFGVRPHTQSAIISGLILTFLFMPATDAHGFVILALVAAIAMASKYLLAWRGRHIFNPVAIAAVIIYLTGLSGATWWVATPTLFVPIVVFGLLILYRTGRMQMGLLFIGVALVLTALQTGLGTVLWQTLLYSYPILFLAFFMLSEPLTQPPRHWQRLIVALVVAILVGLQLKIGPIHGTPEFALIVGNIVAFFFANKSGVRLKLERREELSGGQVAYYFRPQRRLHFVAGQYLELTVPHRRPDHRGTRRRFTIASAPDDELVRIIIRNREPNSSYKTALAAIEPGTVLNATGIYGDFVLPDQTDEKLLFFAGGIGITPFLAHLAALKHAKQQRDIVLLYFVRNEDDAVASEELSSAKAEGVKVHIVAQKLDGDLIRQCIEHYDGRSIYVSGAPAMVDAVVATARSIKAPRVKKDQFDGY